MTLINTTNVASATGSYKGTRAVVTEVGVVLKPLTVDGKRLKAGAVLDPEFVRGLRRENRRALIENEFIQIHATSLELTADGS
jgi:hypothetical protein